jgi:hypothetical protein
MALTARAPRAWAAQSDYLLPPPEAESLRALALGGAFVGLADDAGTLSENPAGLVAVPRSFDFLLGAAGTATGTRPRHAGLAFHPHPWLAGGVSWSQRLPTDLLAAPSAPRTSAEALTALSGPALGLGAFLPDRRFSVGVTARWQKLTTEALGPEASSWSTSFTAGLLFRPSHDEAPRVGLRYVHRSDWTLEGPEGPRQVRSPSVLSAGVSWHYRILRISRLLFSLQPDWVLYSQLTEGPAGATRTRDDIDLRLGLEASFPMQCYTGCGSMLQVRFGLANAAPRPFSTPSLGARGSGVGQGSSRETRWTAGVALALRAAMTGRIKLEATYDRASRTFAFGFGLRFPGAYRADIEDETRR